MVVKNLTTKRLLAALAAGAALAAAHTAPAAAAQHGVKLADPGFSFEGPLGKFDRGALQRGFKVYAEVCSACHSMDLMYYRNLAQAGGPFFNERYPNPNDSPYSKAIAAGVMVADIDPDTGDDVERAATPADRFRRPFRNEAAARASNGGALPPDLSVMAKARAGGPAYIYSILTGYHAPPAGLEVPPGQYYNAYMAGDLASYWKGPKDKVPHGGFLAMPPQITPDRVTFDDGTKSTVEQQAKDVATFLAWASEPLQEERKKTGWAVMLYLLLFAGIMYASYRKIWKNVAH
jgi:ubiquinol-cytochrome c reductase cytochrome c1 subunit